MNRHRRALLLIVAATLAAPPIPASAQAPVAPVAPPVTLWRFLGIPQGVNAVRDTMTNRRGNFPGLERKPPLRSIADPRNLESSNPAIKKAAEIKQQEDLAKQKIKAIKYLASIGCGCYPGVKEALMAALDDCTEKVRYEAAKAIGEAASNQCETCNKRCCCDEELTLKLAEIAYERDDECCWLERSDRVREAAREALMACCRGGSAPPDAGPIEIPEQREVPLDQPEVPFDQQPREVPLNDPPPPPPTDDATQHGLPTAPITVGEHPQGPALGQTVIIEEHVVTTAPATRRMQPPSSRRGRNQAVAPVAMAPQTQSATVEPPAEATPRRLKLMPIQADDLSSLGGQHLGVPASTVGAKGLPQDVDLAAHVDRAMVMQSAQIVTSGRTTPAPVSSKPVGGTVATFDRQTGLVELRFPAGWQPAVGSWVLVYHNYLLERVCLGALEIVDSRPGAAMARATSDMKTADLARGDEVVSRR